MRVPPVGQPDEVSSSVRPRQSRLSRVEVQTPDDPYSMQKKRSPFDYGA